MVRLLAMAGWALPVSCSTGLAPTPSRVAASARLDAPIGVPQGARGVAFLALTTALNSAIARVSSLAHLRMLGEVPHGLSKLVGREVAVHGPGVAQLIGGAHTQARQRSDAGWWTWASVRSAQGRLLGSANLPVPVRVYRA